jgi:hypothetical protein
MLHHLFKNAAPGSNAAIWRGLFYREHLARQPKRWIPLIACLLSSLLISPALLITPWLVCFVYQKRWDEDYSSGEWEFSQPPTLTQQMISCIVGRSAAWVLLILFIILHYFGLGLAVNLLVLRPVVQSWDPDMCDHLLPCIAIVIAIWTHQVREGWLRSKSDLQWVIFIGSYVVILGLILKNEMALQSPKTAAIYAASAICITINITALFFPPIYLISPAKATTAPMKPEVAAELKGKVQRSTIFKLLFWRMLAPMLPRHPLWRGLLMREHFRCGGKALVAWILLICLAFQNHHPLLSVFIGILYFPLIAAESQTKESLEAELSRPYKLWQQYAAAMLYHAVPLLLIAILHCCLHHQALISPFTALLCVSLIPLHRLQFVERHLWVSGSLAFIFILGVLFVGFNISNVMEMRSKFWLSLFLAASATALAVLGLQLARHADLDIRQEAA